MPDNEEPARSTAGYTAEQLQAALGRTYGLIDILEARAIAGDAPAVLSYITDYWHEETRLATSNLVANRVEGPSTSLRLAAAARIGEAAVRWRTAHRAWIDYLALPIGQGWTRPEAERLELIARNAKVEFMALAEESEASVRPDGAATDNSRDLEG